MSYTPEFYCGFTGWNEQLQPTYGLVPWPEHLQPRPEPALELTKKGEAYCALVEAQEGVVINLTAADRAAIEEAIERLIALLDAVESDSDLEEAGDDEPTVGWSHTGAHGHQLPDECEEVSEDEAAQCEDEGADSDREPFLGWSETCSQGPKAGFKNDAAVQCLDQVGDPDDTTPLGGEGRRLLHFDGDGCLSARQVLRNLRHARPDVPQEHIGGWCDGDPNALRVDGLSIHGTKEREPRHKLAEPLVPQVPLLKASDFDNLPWA